LWQWNAADKKWRQQHRLRGHSSAITGAVFRPGDARVVTSSGDQSVRQWDTATGEEIPEGALKLADWVSSISLAPSGNQLLVGSVGAPVQLWDLDRASAVAQFDVGESRVSAVEISPDGLLAAAVCSEERIVGSGT
jgi:WD40 repeat protein